MDNFNFKKYLAEGKLLKEEELNEEIVPQRFGRRDLEKHSTMIANIFEKDLFPKHGYDRTDGYIGVVAKRAGMSKEDYIKKQQSMFVNIILNNAKRKLGID